METYPLRATDPVPMRASGRGLVLCSKDDCLTPLDGRRAGRHYNHRRSQRDAASRPDQRLRCHDPYWACSLCRLCDVGFVRLLKERRVALALHHARCFGLFLVIQFSGQFLFPNFAVTVTRQSHPVYYLAMARICLVNILLILGVVVALIKCTSKLLYGIAEVVVAVVSNVAIITPLNLSDFPKTHFKITELLALGALAYLFSKGIGDAVDGVGDIRKKLLAKGANAVTVKGI